MPKSIYTSQSHYVYRITNILLNKHYYGSRSCKNCNPHDDLGIKYFSSSKDKDFIKDQKEHPEHYKYKIIKICETRKDAIELEILLHEKFDVGINENFYNRAKQTSARFNVYGLKPSEEHRKKLSAARKGEKNPSYGKKHTEETRKKIGAASKGRKHSEETRKKMSETRKGKPKSKETKKKMSDALKGENCFWYRKKHSEGTRKKMSEAKKGIKHTEEHKMKLSDAKKGEKHPQFKGYYVTPFGKFASALDKQIKENNIYDSTVSRWCKNNTTIISKMSYAKSKYLQENFDESIIGKTYKDIGFSFEYVT